MSDEANFSTSGTGGAAAAPSSTPDREDAAQRLMRGAHAAVDQAADRLGPAIDRLGAEMQAASETMDAWVEDGRACVRRHPLSSVAIALAVGMVLGRFLVR